MPSILNANEMFIATSPDLPHEYPNNAYKLWHLSVPTNFTMSINLVFVEIELNKDYIFIGHGSGQPFNRSSASWTHITGYLRSVWEDTSSSSVTIIFTSDGQTRAFGFQIECIAVGMNERRTSKCN